MHVILHFRKFNRVDNLSIQLHVQKIWISKEIQNENENELNINFLSGLRGQIDWCMFLGGLFIN
jgi:hypothetical protein